MATKITTRVLADDAVTDAKIADVTLTTATQAASDNTTKIATTAYVTTAIANLADSAPSTLNTLNELAAALGDDANYATTTTNAIAAKAPLASPTFTTTITTPDINITGGSQIGQDYAYLKSNSTSTASLTLRKDSTGADCGVTPVRPCPLKGNDLDYLIFNYLTFYNKKLNQIY